jgi:hypothetical protein
LEYLWSDRLVDQTDMYEPRETNSSFIMAVLPRHCLNGKNSGRHLANSA